MTRKRADNPGKLWSDVVAQLAAFDEHRAKLDALDPRAPVDPDDEVIHRYRFLNQLASPTLVGPLSEWMKACCTERQRSALEGARVPQGWANEVLEGKRSLSDLQGAVEMMAHVIQDVIGDVAPAEFKYSGFAIDNEERMTDQVVRSMLEGVDYIFGLFKRRGCEKLLHGALRRIILASDPKRFGATNAAGMYLDYARSIALFTNMLANKGGTQLDHWVNEVFLHEFGHWVHLKFLPREAKDAWDKPWQEVDAARALVRKVSLQDRVRFFGLIERSGWDVGKASRKLSPEDKIKYGVWLREGSTQPLITERQFRLTPFGKYTFDFFKDPAGFLKREDDYSPADGSAYHERLEQRTNQFRKRLMLDESYELPISQALVDEMAQANPEINHAVDQLLDKLKIVTEYGKKNEAEDFAETFVAFMAAPGRLSDVAKFRMQRALSLSGLYGKRVVRLAQRVVTRYVAGRAGRGQAQESCPTEPDYANSYASIGPIVSGCR